MDWSIVAAAPSLNAKAHCEPAQLERRARTKFRAIPLTRREREGERDDSAIYSDFGEHFKLSYDEDCAQPKLAGNFKLWRLARVEV